MRRLAWRPQLLDAISDHSPEAAYHVLQQLGLAPVTIRALRATKVGRFIQRLHDHSDVSHTAAAAAAAAAH